MTMNAPPRPCFALTAPRLSMRELLLAAQCLELKNTVVAQQIKLTGHEESGRHDAAKIADLLRRNATLTAALHRTACAG
jgi:hypothetical protein